MLIYVEMSITEIESTTFAAMHKSYMCWTNLLTLKSQVTHDVI